jgi:hypothetical protein
MRNKFWQTCAQPETHRINVLETAWAGLVLHSQSARTITAGPRRTPSISSNRGCNTHLAPVSWIAKDGPDQTCTPEKRPACAKMCKVLLKLHALSRAECPTLDCVSKRHCRHQLRHVRHLSRATMRQCQRLLRNTYMPTILLSSKAASSFACLQMQGDQVGYVDKSGRGYLLYVQARLRSHMLLSGILSSHKWVNPPCQLNTLLHWWRPATRRPHSR